MGLGQVGRAVGLFTVTNIDDLLLWALFFGRAAGRGGGCCGWCSVSTSASSGSWLSRLLAALGAGLLPESVLPYLGLLPLALGLRSAWRLWLERHDQAPDGMTEPVGPGALSLAAVTFEVQVRALRAGCAPMPHRAGHVEAVRALVLDPLTKPQVRQLTDIGRRIMRVVNPDDRHLDPSR